MNKRVSIDIVKNVLLPGLLIGSYMGLYFNLFYFSKSLLKMGGMLSYVVPIIVIAMMGIIMYLLNDKQNYFLATIEFSKLSQSKLSVKPYLNHFSPFQINANLLNISGLILWQCSKIFSK